MGVSSLHMWSRRHVQRRRTTACVCLCTGSLAGFFAQTIVFPGDTVRKRMMANGVGGSTRTYRTSIDCFCKLWSKEGISAFYSGMLPCALRALPSGAIQFGSYELLKALLAGSREK
eukprot:GHVQ01023944.1.p1 GENE.GHVQ01023944.1~~GHVQ01023944.1.p1  ORF type:complete len:116 (+),score=8.48 GHVQ01023944.1:98-445(+)